MRILILVLSSFFLFITSCKKDSAPGPNLELDSDLDEVLSAASDGVGKSHFILPNSDNFSEIPQDPRNPITAEKVKLGMYLFHETGIALNPMNEISKETYSCATCHIASAGFQSGRFQALGDGGIGIGLNGEGRVKGALYKSEEVDASPVRAPSAMNGAYQEAVMWSGFLGSQGVNIGTESSWVGPSGPNNMGFGGVESQAISGLVGHRFGIDISFIQKYPEYQELFDEAFPRETGDEKYNLVNVGLAIAAYERTLLANQAPFQKWLRGDNLAMSDDEKEGAILFFGKANCSNCHNGPALNKMEFHALGMEDLNRYKGGEVYISDPNSPPPANLGRGSFTFNPDDNYKFKVPQLYNVSDSPYYGHGSSFRSIKEVVDYKNNGISQNEIVPEEQLAEDFVPLNLTEEEVNSIVSFLETGLRDPSLIRYVPEILPTRNCFPNSDPLSKDQLGCN